MLMIQTTSETYSVDADNNIGRPSIGMKPSGQWKLRGFVRYNNFGHVVDRCTADYLISPGGNTDRQELLFYKNGKGKWHVLDCDHGTNREWGEPIIGIARWNTP